MNIYIFNAVFHWYKVITEGKCLCLVRISSFNIRIISFSIIRFNHVYSVCRFEWDKCESVDFVKKEPKNVKPVWTEFWSNVKFREPNFSFI